MMKVTGYTNNQAGRKTVWIEGILVGTEDIEIKNLAMQHAGETHFSIFDSEIKRDKWDVSKAVVHLLTD